MSQQLTKILAVDFGTVRVGLAISDPDRKFSFPLETLTRRDKDSDADFFRKLVVREEVGAIVVGLPVHLDGRESREATLVGDYGAWLAEVTGLPVSYHDERFSTVNAGSALWDAGLSQQQRKARQDA